MRRERYRHQYFIEDFRAGDREDNGWFAVDRMTQAAFLDQWNIDTQFGGNEAIADHLRWSREVVDQELLFHMVFGRTVRGVSGEATANLLYADVRFGAPVFIGNVVQVETHILGVEFKKDGTDNGSVHVHTVGSNLGGDMVLEFRRGVLVPARTGRTFNKSDSSGTFQHPQTIDESKWTLPPAMEGLSRTLLGELGMTFEQLTVGETLLGTREGQIPLWLTSQLQIMTANSAVVHHKFQHGGRKRQYITYGGAPKAFAWGALSELLPLAWQIGMDGGKHLLPTFPPDMLGLVHQVPIDDDVERLRAKLVVKELRPLQDLPWGLVRGDLITEKRITAVGLKALAMDGVDITRIGGSEGDWVPVMNLQIAFALPTAAAFAS